VDHLRITIVLWEIVRISHCVDAGLIWQRLRSSQGCQGREAAGGAAELLVLMEGHGHPVVSQRTIFA
jgi:hypothetical protein